VDDERDSIELSLLDKFIMEKKPYLGICRGFQLVTVGLGGSLYTHIEDQMPARSNTIISRIFPAATLLTK